MYYNSVEQFIKKFYISIKIISMENINKTIIPEKDDNSVYLNLSNISSCVNDITLTSNNMEDIDNSNDYEIINLIQEIKKLSLKPIQNYIIDIKKSDTLAREAIVSETHQILIECFKYSLKNEKVFYCLNEMVKKQFIEFISLFIKLRKHDKSKRNVSYAKVDCFKLGHIEESSKGKELIFYIVIEISTFINFLITVKQISVLSILIDKKTEVVSIKVHDFQTIANYSNLTYFNLLYDYRKIIENGYSVSSSMDKSEIKDNKVCKYDSDVYIDSNKYDEIHKVKIKDEYESKLKADSIEKFKRLNNNEAMLNICLNNKEFFSSINCKVLKFPGKINNMFNSLLLQYPFKSKSISNLINICNMFKRKQKII